MPGCDQPNLETKNWIFLKEYYFHVNHFDVGFSSCTYNHGNNVNECFVGLFFQATDAVFSVTLEGPLDSKENFSAFSSKFTSGAQFFHIWWYSSCVMCEKMESRVQKGIFNTQRSRMYCLLTDLAEGLAGIAILHHCLARFHPLPPGWFKFGLERKWHLDVILGCFMFPLINWLSQMNLDLLPIPPPISVTALSVEQSNVTRDPTAMTLYAVVVSVCAPIWVEIVFRGFSLL